ncbi:MAG: hypothetical protein HKN31_02445, partial [Pricia sp.]|nr:hypothetical protein [Pricia sp.]
MKLTTIKLRMARMNRFIVGLMIALFICACNDGKKSKKTEKETVEQDWLVLFDGGSTDAFRGYGINEFPEGVWS